MIQLLDLALVGGVGFQEFLASLSCWPEVRCRDGNLRWISVSRPAIPDVKRVDAPMAVVQLCVQLLGDDV